MRDTRERLPVQAPRPTGGQAVAALTGISLVSAGSAGCVALLAGAGPAAVVLAVWSSGWLSCLLWVGLLVGLSAVRGRRRPRPVAAHLPTARHPGRGEAWSEGPAVVRLRRPEDRG